MFKNLSLDEKVKVKTRIMHSILAFISIMAIYDFYKILKSPSNFWECVIGMTIIALASAIIIEFLKRWVNSTISEPIYNAIVHSNTASSEIIENTSKQEASVNNHIQLLRDAANILEKLSTFSLQTKMSAQKVSEKSRDILNMSSKEHEAVKANIEKMRTLKQKIEIIAELILELSEHTQQIGSIIGVVEDITEQTNMLALNAAVEAARAGEHGKGFAVVASEIRKLADESKQATSKISAIIHDIQQATNSTVMATEEGTKEIESGVDLAHQIAHSIDVLRDTIGDTVRSVDDIVNASSNQSACTNDVYDTISSINQGMLDSAKNIKESLSTLQGLVNISRTLKEKVVGDNINKSGNDFVDYKVR